MGRIYDYDFISWFCQCGRSPADTRARAVLIIFPVMFLAGSPNSTPSGASRPKEAAPGGDPNAGELRELAGSRPAGSASPSPAFAWLSAESVCRQSVVTINELAVLAVGLPA